MSFTDDTREAITCLTEALDIILDNTSLDPGKRKNAEVLIDRAETLAQTPDYQIVGHAPGQD